MQSKQSALGWVSQAFWVADVMIVVMLVSFMVLSGQTGSAAFTLVLAAMAAAYAIYALVRHSHHEDAERSPMSRQLRERRGF